jgi:hypothetical protein
VIKAGPYTFNSVDYDEGGDVLYVSLNAPKPGIGEETPELHVWRFDQDGSFTGITFVSPRELYRREGALWVTLPDGERVTVEGVDSLLT